MGLFRRGPTWWMSFTYNGRQVRQSTETDDKKLAEKIHHKVMTEVAEGKWFERPVGQTKTFREMMEKYMAEPFEGQEEVFITGRSIAQAPSSLFRRLPTERRIPLAYKRL